MLKWVAHGVTIVLMSRKQLVRDHEFTIDTESLYKYTIALCILQVPMQFFFSEPYLLFHCSKDYLDACLQRTHVILVHVEVTVHQTPAQETYGHCHNLELSPSLLSEPAHTGLVQQML